MRDRHGTCLKECKMRGNCKVLARERRLVWPGSARARYLHQGRVDNLGFTHNLELIPADGHQQQQELFMSTYATCLRATGVSSWVTGGVSSFLPPKNKPIAYGQSHLGIKCNDTVLVCYVGNIKHRKHGANQNYDRRIDGWRRWPEIR